MLQHMLEQSLLFCISYKKVRKWCILWIEYVPQSVWKEHIKEEFEEKGSAWQCLIQESAPIRILDSVLCAFGISLAGGEAATMTVPMERTSAAFLVGTAPLLAENTGA